MTVPQTQTQVHVKNLPLWSIAVFAITTIFAAGIQYNQNQNTAHQVLLIRNEIEISRVADNKTAVQTQVMASQLRGIESSVDRLADQIEMMKSTRASK